jgi:hypothetical protein
MPGVAAIDRTALAEEFDLMYTVLRTDTARIPIIEGELVGAPSSHLLARLVRAAMAPLGMALWLLAGVAVYAGGLTLAENLDSIALTILGGGQ